MKENILDSEEIHKEPDAIYMPQLELGEKEDDDVLWTPVVAGGANFKTHKLVTIEEDIIKFSGTLGNYVFGLIFFVPGLIIFLFALVIFDPIMIAFGLVFGGVGALMLDSHFIPIVFNRRIGLYWKARLPIVDRLFTNKKAFSVKIEDIKSVQLLKEHVSSSDGSYDSYEINLVLENNERLNVVDHGNEESARKDAAHLAKFLNVSLLSRV